MKILKNELISKVLLAISFMQRNRICPVYSANGVLTRHNIYRNGIRVRTIIYKQGKVSSVKVYGSGCKELSISYDINGVLRKLSVTTESKTLEVEYGANGALTYCNNKQNLNNLGKVVRNALLGSNNIEGLLAV